MATALARPPAAPPAAPKTTVSAVEMGARQREISVSEFFTKNRHLLGFDNPRKALLTCVKEAVDNALDACRGGRASCPTSSSRSRSCRATATAPPASQATRFRVTVTDNGPGIVRQQIPPIFAKLLYGSKFHRLRMSRGQQGIGISAAGMYAPAHHRQAGADHLAHRRAGGRPLLRDADRHQEERAADLREQEDRLGARRAAPRSRSRSRAATRRAAPRWTSTSSRWPSPTRTCSSSTTRRTARRGSIRATIQELPPQPTRDQAASVRHRARHAAEDAAGHQEPLAGGLPRRRLQPRVHRSRRGDLQDGEALAGRAAAQRSRRGRRGALQGDPDDQDHGAAVELHLAHRREGDPPRPLQADQGRVLHRGDPARRRSTAATRSSSRRAWPTARARTRRRAAAAEAPAVPLAEGEEREATTTSWRASSATPTACRCSTSSRPAPRSRPCWRPRGELRRGPVPRRAAGRAHGDLRPHGLGLGAVHQRVQGSDRRLRRDPQGDQARAAGVRPPARRVPAPARAGQERVPPAQHLRAVHRGGRRGLRPAEGRQAAEGEAQGPAPEDRRASGPAAPGPTRSWARTAARRACRTRSSSPPRGPRARRRELPGAEASNAAPPKRRSPRRRRRAPAEGKAAAAGRRRPSARARRPGARGRRAKATKPGREGQSREGRDEAKEEIDGHGASEGEDAPGRSRRS